jgi:ABC-type amino acid transport substrate-binding protein
VTTSLFSGYRRRSNNQRTLSSGYQTTVRRNSRSSGLQGPTTKHGRAGARPSHNISGALAVLSFGICLSFACLAADSPTPAPPAVHQPAEPRILRGGWYPWDPYQYRENARGNETLTGFDVEIERAVARVMGVELLLPEISWDSHLAGLETGARDIAVGATYSSERDQYAYFSKPYRRETDVLIVLRGTSSKYPFETVDQMLDFFQKQHFRLGVVSGFAYADQRVNAYIADPANAALVIKEDNDLTNLENLLQERIDGFLADHGIVRDPFVLLIIIGTVLMGMLVIRITSLIGAKRFTESLRARGRLGTGLIQICDGLGLAAFLVIGVVVVLDTSVQPLWLWGPISAGITSSFGGMMRDLLRRDAMAPKLQQELYPEIAVIWGFVFSVFLQWEAERLQPREIFVGVVVTIVGAFLTRMLAIAFRLKGWAYGW